VLRRAVPEQSSNQTCRVEYPTVEPCVYWRDHMTVSAISHYRGGAIDEVAPLAKTLRAIYISNTGSAIGSVAFKPDLTRETGWLL
jgi:hypothetical protein